MSITLRKEAVYPHPPEKVWIALTDRRALAEWLMPNDFEPVVGHRFRLQVDPMWGISGLNECEVIEVEPNQKLVYTWVVVPKNPEEPRPGPMTLSWTLEPVSDGTRLILEQSGLENLSFFERLSMKFGWGTMLKHWIPRVLRNVRDGTFTPGAIPLNKRCYKTRTIPQELTR
jgi:uncharacterized protein YndB with AHSA1/START domain